MFLELVDERRRDTPTRNTAITQTAWRSAVPASSSPSVPEQGQSPLATNVLLPQLRGSTSCLRVTPVPRKMGTLRTLVADVSLA
jgi:hypothetical protein